METKQQTYLDLESQAMKLKNTGNRPLELSDRFIQGYVCACSAILQSHGYSSQTEIIEAMGAIYQSREQLISEGVDIYDIEILSDVLLIIENRRRVNL